MSAVIIAAAVFRSDTTRRATGSKHYSGLGRAAVRVAMGAVVAALIMGFHLRSAQEFHGRVLHQIRSTGHELALSDLFPRWYGARRLLGGENPYAAAFTADLQRAYYGRTLDPEEEIRLFRSRLGFFYPPYVVLPLLPVLALPFELARWLTVAALTALVGGSVAAWLRTSAAKLSTRQKVLSVLLVVTFSPLFDLLWLQQLSGVVMAYLVGAHIAASRGKYLLCGSLLALSMIKPQLAVLPAAGLLFWGVWDRRRYPIMGSFAAVMILQLVLAHVLMPNWLGAFFEEVGRYRESNSGLYWLPAMLAGDNTGGALYIAIPLLALLFCAWWRCRHAEASEHIFLANGSLAFAVAVAVLPADSVLYNKTLLLIPIVYLITAGLGRRLLGRLVVLLAAVSVGMLAFAMGVAGWLGMTGFEHLARVASLGSTVGYLVLPIVVAGAVAARSLLSSSMAPGWPDPRAI